MMRKISSKLTIILLIFSIVFAACKKDDKVEIQNKIVYGGSDYELSKGYLESHGIENTSPNTYGWFIILTSSEITINYITATMSGVGDGLVFEVYSSETDLNTGTYTFDEFYTCNANTIAWAALILDYDFADLNKKAETLEEITDGTVEIEKSGSEYELTINCTVSGDKTFTAYYKGSLEFHDFSSAKQGSFKNLLYQ